MKNYAKGEIAEILLTELAFNGLVFLRALKPVYRYGELFGAQSFQDRYRIQQAVRRLLQKKYVRVVRAKDREILTITASGRKEMEKYRLKDLSIKKPKGKWDGFWHVVIFDIPEEKRGIRNAVSAKLRQIGFHPLQKSAFIIPYECREEIDFIGNYFGVRQYIRYIVSKDIDIDENIVAFFKERIS